MNQEMPTENNSNKNPGHTTIVNERRGSGGLIIAFIVLVALGLAVFFYAQNQNSEMARDSAITGAAQQVGESAQKAGEAVENAVRKPGEE